MNISENVFIKHTKLKRALNKIKKNDKEVKEGVDLASFAKDLVEKKKSLKEGE